MNIPLFGSKHIVLMHLLEVDISVASIFYYCIFMDILKQVFVLLLLLLLLKCLFSGVSFVCLFSGFLGVFGNRPHSGSYLRELSNQWQFLSTWYWPWLLGWCHSQGH